MTLTTHSHTKQSLYSLIFLFLFLVIKLFFGGMMVFLDPPDRAFFKEFWFLTLDWQVPSSGGIDSHHNAQYEQLRHHGGFTSGTCLHSDWNRRVEVTYSLWMLVVPLSPVHSAKLIWDQPLQKETDWLSVNQTQRTLAHLTHEGKHSYLVWKKECYYVNILWISYYCVKRSCFTPESNENKYRPYFVYKKM